YSDSQTQLLIPAPLSPEGTVEVRRLAVETFKACECSGMARVDLFVSRDESTIFVNELNTIPGFTNISMYPKLWEATGVSYRELGARRARLDPGRRAGRARRALRQPRVRLGPGHEHAAGRAVDVPGRPPGRRAVLRGDRRLRGPTVQQHGRHPPAFDSARRGVNRKVL